MKLISFSLFGLGGLVLAMVVFPALLLFPVRGKQDVLMRKTIRWSFVLFLCFMKITRIIKIRVNSREKLHGGPYIICANHPTLLDVVIIVAMISNASCIVKASHWNNFFIKWIVSRIYIPNSLGSEQTILQCQKNLDAGNHLVLFPESSRTNFNKTIKFHRSAAHIALSSGYDILPIHIDASRPSGLGKDDRLLSSPHNGIIEYTLTFKNPIPLASIKEMPRPMRARELTKNLLIAIFAKENEHGSTGKRT